MVQHVPRPIPTQQTTQQNNIVSKKKKLESSDIVVIVIVGVIVPLLFIVLLILVIRWLRLRGYCRTGGNSGGKSGNTLQVPASETEMQCVYDNAVKGDDEVVG